MAHSNPDDSSVLLVHAYLDDELDPANALAVAQRMNTEPALTAEGERVKALRQLIHERLPRELAPPGLHARIEASVGRRGRGRAQPSWRSLAASIAVTAMVTSSATWVMVGSGATDTMADSLVSDHIRALVAPQPIDVVSSDRHTVKPWFNGRVRASPRVVDLAKEDFPLVGGRVAVVDQTLVPTLVYRHRQHLISLTEMPCGSRFGLARTPRMINGYNLLRWTEDGVSYWAVSDLAPTDLEDFAQLFRTSPSDQ